MDEGERRVLWFMCLLIATEVVLSPLFLPLFSAWYPTQPIYQLFDWFVRGQFGMFLAYIVFVKTAMWAVEYSKSRSEKKSLVLPENVSSEGVIQEPPKEQVSQMPKGRLPLEMLEDKTEYTQ